MTIEELKNEADKFTFYADEIKILITKAYERGFIDGSELTGRIAAEELEEMPQMKGTLEALDNLTPSHQVGCEIRED